MIRRKHVFIVGFSGSGKSTLGRILASRLKYRFVDLDTVLERQARLSVSGIFAKGGEGSFRRMEIAQLRRVLRSDRPLVIALGGGAFESDAIRRVAGRSGVTVFLSCSQRQLYRRLRGVKDRPLLDARPRENETPSQARARRVRHLLKKRLANYRSADLILSTSSKSVAQSAGQLVRLLKTVL